MRSWPKRPAPRCSASAPAPVGRCMPGLAHRHRGGAWPGAPLLMPRARPRPRRAVLDAPTPRRRLLEPLADREASDAALEEGAPGTWLRRNFKVGKPVIWSSRMPSVRAAGWHARCGAVTPAAGWHARSAASSAWRRALKASTGGGPLPTESPRPPASGTNFWERRQRRARRLRQAAGRRAADEGNPERAQNRHRRRALRRRSPARQLAQPAPRLRRRQRRTTFTYADRRASSASSRPSALFDDLPGRGRRRPRGWPVPRVWSSIPDGTSTSSRFWCLVAAREGEHLVAAVVGFAARRMYTAERGGARGATRRASVTGRPSLEGAFVAMWGFHFATGTRSTAPGALRGLFTRGRAASARRWICLCGGRRVRRLLRVPPRSDIAARAPDPGGRRRSSPTSTAATDIERGNVVAVRTACRGDQAAARDRVGGVNLAMAGCAGGRYMIRVGRLALSP
jgi:hypothetical protein